LIFVDIENLQTEIEVCDELKSLINDIAVKCLENENFSFNAELNVLLVNDIEMAELNNVHRGINKTTDVLSFPMLFFEGKVPVISETDKNPENGCVIIGDIIISLQKASAQSEQYGHSLNREIAFLMSHGMYHLMGYDHDTPALEKEMLQKQENVLAELKITR
jgi:probable rRNA maturation factor